MKRFVGDDDQPDPPPYFWQYINQSRCLLTMYRNHSGIGYAVSVLWKDRKPLRWQLYRDGSFGGAGSTGTLVATSESPNGWSVGWEMITSAQYQAETGKSLEPGTQGSTVPKVTVFAPDDTLCPPQIDSPPEYSLGLLVQSNPTTWVVSHFMQIAMRWDPGYDWRWSPPSITVAASYPQGTPYTITCIGTARDSNPGRGSNGSISPYLQTVNEAGDQFTLIAPMSPMTAALDGSEIVLTAQMFAMPPCGILRYQVRGDTPRTPFGTTPFPILMVSINGCGDGTDPGGGGGGGGGGTEPEPEKEEDEPEQGGDDDGKSIISYDLSRFARRVRARVAYPTGKSAGNRLWVELGADFHGAEWEGPDGDPEGGDTGIDGAFPCIRWEKADTRSRLWLAYVKTQTVTKPDKVRVRYSDDEGRTWCEEVDAVALTEAGRHPQLVSARDGRLICLWLEAGVIKGKIVSAVSQEVVEDTFTALEGVDYYSPAEGVHPGGDWTVEALVRKGGIVKLYRFNTETLLFEEMTA